MSWDKFLMVKELLASTAAAMRGLMFLREK